MLRAHAARKRDQKILKLETTKANGERTLAALDAELQALNDSTSQPAPTPTPTPARAYAPTLPQPPTWKPESKDANATSKLIYSITDTELKQRVLEGAIKTAIADSGATSSYGNDAILACGKYKLASSLISTGKPSGKIFQYAQGSLGVSTEMKHLPFDVRGKAKEIHMTPGLQNHLLSTNKFTEENYV